ILVGTQYFVGIRKFELPGQCSRRRVDGALDRVEAALLRKDGSIRKDQLDAELADLVGLFAAPRDSQIFRFRDGAAKQNRIDLRNSGEHRGLAAADEGSNFLFGRTDDPVRG